MLKVVAQWSGFIGGPGYSNFYFDGFLEGGTVPQQVHDKVKNFFNEVDSNLPLSVRVAVSPIVAELDPATGALQEETTVATADPGTTGLQSGAYAAVAGACISWGTGGIVAGKRVRGRTFIVPLGGNTFQTDGTLAPGTITGLQTAAAILIAPPLSAGTDFGIWHRPVNGAGGSWHKATTGKVADKSAFLKSRRD